MTRVVIVGEIYNADLSVGGGPMPGGPGWSPVDPGYGRPGWSPVDPGYGRPDYAPGHPGNRPPGSWDGTHPGNRPPGSWSGGQIDNTLPGTMPQGGTEVPPDVMAPPPVPEEIASQFIVSVYNPKTMTWTTKSYPPR